MHPIRLTLGIANTHIDQEKCGAWKVEFEDKRTAPGSALTLNPRPKTHTTLNKKEVLP